MTVQNEGAAKVSPDPAYRVVSSDRSNDRWVVVAYPTEAEPNPAPVAVDLDHKAAEKECDRLNALYANWPDGDAERRDAVLGRMLATKA